MNKRQIKDLADNGLFRGRRLKGDTFETHISWIILSRTHVFKIKKPVKLHFLDFSKLALRRKMCRRELALNRRTTKIYRSVLPIRSIDGRFVIGGKSGKIIEYAVYLKRIKEDLRLDHLLKKKKVSVGEIQSLARIVARFHKRSPVVRKKFDLAKSKELFNEIAEYDQLTNKVVGKKYSRIIRKAIRWSNIFLHDHTSDFIRRASKGFIRDVHGDLHSGNIFMEKIPVIFDCIEFNDDYRRIDVLYEIAFLAMDIEASGSRRIASELLRKYSEIFPCFDSGNDLQLLNYFKCLRANIRAKVHIIGIQQASGDVNEHVEMARSYINLMSKYIKIQ